MQRERQRETINRFGKTWGNIARGKIKQRVKGKCKKGEREIDTERNKVSQGDI